MTDNKRQRQRSDYPFFLSYRTRWSDNDQYAHLNNTTYYHLFDAIINTYLIHHCGLDPRARPFIGLVVSSFCEYFSPLSFPDVLDLGLRVTHLGKSSVTYEVGVFKARIDHLHAPAAVGGYTHVFVDNISRKSVAMSNGMRNGLLRLVKQTDGRTMSKL
ncbi:thioesterase thiol ester dehydrase-isomerase [Phlebopus sp. FC_14]|nr:thioesterase thiol ester dehydrase-isomerase [Phlebopus sp. FC_14]